MPVIKPAIDKLRKFADQKNVGEIIFLLDKLLINPPKQFDDMALVFNKLTDLQFKLWALSSKATKQQKELCGAVEAVNLALPQLLSLNLALKPKPDALFSHKIVSKGDCSTLDEAFLKKYNRLPCHTLTPSKT